MPHRVVMPNSWYRNDTIAYLSCHGLSASIVAPVYFCKLGNAHWPIERFNTITDVWCYSRTCHRMDTQQSASQTRPLAVRAVTAAIAAIAVIDSSHGRMCCCCCCCHRKLIPAALAADITEAQPTPWCSR